jgi:hypothetical protein
MIRKSGNRFSGRIMLEAVGALSLHTASAGGLADIGACQACGFSSSWIARTAAAPAQGLRGMSAGQNEERRG